MTGHHKKGGGNTAPTFIVRWHWLSREIKDLREAKLF